MRHDITKINALLTRAGAAAGGRVDWFESIDSTNTWLLRQRDAHARVCIAEWQSAGRGRRGRVWRAPASSAVLLSIGWHLDGAATAGLSLVSGLAVLNALRELGVDSLALKWPNDVLAMAEAGDDSDATVIGKLGGILTELNGARCVIGMGINVAAEASPPETSPSETSPSESSPSETSSPESPAESPGADEMPRIDLHSLRYSIDRDQLAAELIIAHCDYLRRFCAAGLPAFVDEWNAAHAYRGRSVTVALAGESLQGIARGIDADGALLIDCAGARRRIVSAEARVRAVDVANEAAA